MIKAYPKIFTIGQDYIADIFKESVEITEKIDGSQFGFGKVNGELFCRSKGKQIFFANPEKMFSLAVDHVLRIESLIPDNTIFYAEYLQKPKHNILAYNRIPVNHLILFGKSGINDAFSPAYSDLTYWAEKLNIEAVPIIYDGRIHDSNDLFDLLKTRSILGAVDVEGIVVKNYKRPFLLGGAVLPLMAGKLVSEKFKEKHEKDWKKENTGRGKWETFKEQFCTEARWEKAIQHLRDSGELENSPRDIGKLIKEIHSDVTDEHKDEILEFLWREFRRDIISASTRGFPEWYKLKLAERSFNNG
jgi:hypothetical protein